MLMKQKARILLIACSVAAVVLPEQAAAQGMAGDIRSLQAVLDDVYRDMIPLSSGLIAVGRGIAGFAALWYIAARVWRHIANAEPVDFYPLFRPFALGMLILLYPYVLSLMNGVLQPVVQATRGMVTDSDRAIAALLKRKADAVKRSASWQMYVGADGQGDREKWYKYTSPDGEDSSGEGILESLGNDVRFWMDKQSYNFRNTIKQWMSEVLQVLYEAAALCINTIRTFYLVVLGILGPLVFGFSVFDGFQHTLTVWIARYINVFLWLPVANIFGSILGKIQENMLRLDIGQIESSGDTFFSPTDTAYLIFMVIGIAGYFTVPGVANYIVHAGGGSALLQKVNTIISSSSSKVVSAGSAGSSSSGMMGDALGDQRGRISQGMASYYQSSGYFNGSSYQKDRLSGN
mgnify:CR=1 FL=1